MTPLLGGYEPSLSLISGQITKIFHLSLDFPGNRRGPISRIQKIATFLGTQNGTCVT